MKQDNYILAIDQGTTSSRAIVFDAHSQIIAMAQQEFPQLYPKNGWVEHDPEAIWQSTLQTAKTALQKAESSGAGKVKTIGITNQRETTLLWNRKTGEPLHNAIVWQDRRTADYCATLKDAGAEADIQLKTGLLLDPYFSASKVHWLLSNVSETRKLANAGELCFGTVDSFLIHRLTGGKNHVTDATNASRTALFNIHTGEWDKELLELFDVPENILPRVLDCAAEFGVTDKSFFGREIPILGVAGDQHAAMVGQCCFDVGDIKSTYGTGCFALVNTGEQVLKSRNRLLGTIAYQYRGKIHYALEGSIFVAGAAIQWLRDNLSLIDNAGESAGMSAALASNDGVYFVPAFTGLGAPHWLPDARGAIVGLTRATSPAHIVRAALEAVCYQTSDLLQAMGADGCQPKRMRIDGGMVANDWMNQFLADIVGLTVDKPVINETTALGAAYLAGLQAGIFADFDSLKKQWKLAASYQPALAESQRERYLTGWRRALISVAQH